MGAVPIPMCGGVQDLHGHVAKGGGPGRILLESITTPSGWHFDWSWDDSTFEIDEVARLRQSVIEAVVSFSM
jgi:hypothetical protein